MDIANQMILFAKVVETGGFSAAARDLGLTPSAVSRQIGNLEDRLGARLLNRSTRRVSLTEVGREFHGRCVEIARNVEDAELLVASRLDHPQGTLRISATSAFAKAQLLPILPLFLADNPDLKLSLELTDREIDLIGEQIDVAIRFTEQISDTSMVARKLATNQRIFVAAPDYIRRYGMPNAPEDLVNHNCLRLSTVEKFNNWQFSDGHSKVARRISGNFETNSSDALLHAAIDGLGVAKMSTYLAHDALEEGRLIRVLPDFADEASDILAIYPNRRNLSPNVRAFVDFLAERFGKVPPWERTRRKEMSAA
ncbi:MAG: LysR family transcriptional regulator [Rhodospirillales bacterium]|nr:LysR family transcriptional regulator [Rhodospirillales bacterium]MBO6787137.1 LysR family transcriptional regulator [Rhodospirillales bacterium]